MTTNQIFGILFVVFGLLSLAMYAANAVGLNLPISFWKLGPMRDRWGKTVGTIFHFVSYVVAPIIFGTLLVLGYNL